MFLYGPSGLLVVNCSWGEARGKFNSSPQKLGVTLEIILRDFLVDILRWSGQEFQVPV